MASASSSSSIPGASIPAPQAVQLLVSSLADDSPAVRESAMASLKDIAPLNPLLVLDCCYAVSRGGRRRFGNMAGVFQVMALGVRALEKQDVDPAFLAKLVKIATTEIISSKELNAEWQRSASGLLVSICSHVPDLVMEEIFVHLAGPSSALPAMVQILADFASADALQFSPRLKGVLSRVLPILGNVRDSHRPIFANVVLFLKALGRTFTFYSDHVLVFIESCGEYSYTEDKVSFITGVKLSAFKCWCQAVWQCSADSPSHSPLDADVMSFLNSAFELLLRVWATSRDLKVRASAVEALGQMAGLVTRAQLKAAIPRFVPTILDLYKKDQDIALLATCALHCLLNASLLSETGPPLLEFEELTVILSTLLPVVSLTNNGGDRSDFSVGLKIYNEIQRCFLTVGQLYPDDLFTFLLNKCRLKEESLTYGAVCILKHLLPRSSEAWNNKRPLVVEAVKSLLDEQNLGIKKALCELIAVMASHCYLVGPSGELFVEYLVRHCAISDLDRNDSNFSKMKTGASSLMELRAVCEKGLLLLTITIPETERILWPFLLKMIIPRAYTGAVGTVCRCISELFIHRSATTNMLGECRGRDDIPTPEELFARLLVLLHDPLAREQLPTQILTVLCYLAPLFPKNINLFWQDEIPKMKAYVSDTEDLKSDPSYQEAWDEMILSFLAESLDVIQDNDWMVSLGNAFANQYELYRAEDEHSALLHRCLGMLLQKVDDRNYVRKKIDWMHNQSNITIPANRLGLAKGIGLVAASHLDTILEKLKDILDNIGQTIFQRLLSFFSESYSTEESDDIHAALALMYGYAARYAPSSVIEARIDALVGTNMLSRLLHVHHPTAKQAVITAIDLLGRAVINAAENGASFPLKKRDVLLDYILTLMGRDDNDNFADSSLELLRTKALAVSACTTLVSVEPKLTTETRNLVMKATLGFFALPNEPSDVVNLLVDNLITLLCAILMTSGEDGRSRAEQLLHLLRQMDQYVSSPVEYQRRRGCRAVHDMLLKFRVLCTSGYCALGCQGNCIHVKHIDRPLPGNFSNLPLAFVLPSRESLCLGERVIVYLPRCADPDSEVRKVSAQILNLLFSIALSLPKPAGSTYGADIELSYSALSSLEDVIAILRSDASIDPSEIFNRVVSSICILLTKVELVATLHGCTTAVCDKIKQSAEGAIQAVTEFVTKRGNVLSEADIARTTQSLLTAASHLTEKHMRLETLGAVSSVAESTSSKVVFDEVLAAAGRDIVTKDISRLRGGWPMQDAFYTFSQHSTLSTQFLEHLISLLNWLPVDKNDLEKADTPNHVVDQNLDDHIQLASMFALTAFFRGGGKTGRKVVEQSYASVLASLTLQFGSCHDLASSGQPEPLRALLTAFQAFCECVGDLEMGKILARNGELAEKEKWINLIGDLASCVSIKRPKEWKCGIKLKLARFQSNSANKSGFLNFHLKVDNRNRNRLGEKLNVFSSEVVANHEALVLDDILDKSEQKVQNICVIFMKSFNQRQRSQREVAAAALSEFIRYSGAFSSLLEQMGEELCRHVSDESPTVRRLCLRGLVQIPVVHISLYITQILSVIVALLDDLDESVQLTAVSCLSTILESSSNEAVEPILLNLSLRLRNLQMSMNSKMRADAFAAFGVLSSYASGPHLEVFIEQIHATIPRLVLHLHDDDNNVRQACRNGLKRISPMIEMEGSMALFSSHAFSSDHRRGYEDFLRDLARQFNNLVPSRIDTYMASTIQAFDAPWPIIQANAVYLASSLLSLSDDQRILSLYYTQVFGLLVGKISQSADAVVRAACSSGLGLLLRSMNSFSWRTTRLDRAESGRKGQESESR